MSKPIFYVHIKGQGVRGEVRLNDAPVLELFLEYPQDAFPTISEWVIDGENLLSVHVQASDETAKLDISLCMAQFGDEPDPDTQVPIARIQWPPPGTPTPAAGEGEDEALALPLPSIPPVLSAAGVASHPWGEWNWQRAPAFEGDAATVNAVTAWVRDLHAYLAAGRIDALSGHSAVKFEEVAPLYEMTAADARERLEQAWEYFQAQSGWELAPFDERDLDLRVRCGGRLVEPCTRDGMPILRQLRPTEDGLWSLPIFLARTNWGVVAGQLTIVR